MAQQPFQPSDYPAGERQLDIARSHVDKLLNQYGAGLSPHVVTQLESLHEDLAAAIDADGAEARLAAIGQARERADSLRRDSALNPTHSAGLRRRVSRLLDIATEEISAGD